MVNPIIEQQSTDEINNRNNAHRAFEIFFDRWLIDQERYLRGLIELIQLDNDGGEDEENERRCREMISQVMDHYDRYFEEKARVIREDVFLVVTPTWFSSSERNHLWLGGYRPGLAFRLVFNNVTDLCEDQSQRIDTLMAEAKEEEKSITDEFTRVQESMASPSIIGLVRQLGCTRNADRHSMESAIDHLKESMEALVECADLLRMKIGIKLVEILKPAQAVRFLVAVAQLQLRLRRWGMQRDAQHHRQSPMLSDLENQHRPV